MFFEQFSYELVLEVFLWQILGRCVCLNAAEYAHETFRKQREPGFFALQLKFS